MREKIPKVILSGPDLSAVSGVSTHLNQLLGSALSQKYQMIHFLVGSEGRRESGLRKVFRLVVSPFSLFARILREKPSLLHVNSSLEPKAYWRDLVYMVVARLVGCPVVLQIHGGALPCSFLGDGKVSTGFLRWSLRLASALVLLAKSEKDAYEGFGIGRKLLIIRNAIDLSEYGGIFSKCFQKDLMSFGYIGRLAEDKGVLETVEAFAQLRNEGFGNIRLTIAGSGPAEQELRRMVVKHGISDVVKFEGAIFGHEKMEFWRKIDIFVFPTYHREGLPYTLLESLASATPMITTTVGGIPDLVTEGIQGLFVPEKDIQALEGAMRRLLEDRLCAEKMSREAKLKALEECSIEQLARAFDELYESIGFNGKH